MTYPNLHRLVILFTRRSVKSVDGHCSRCNAPSVHKDDTTPRSYCSECGGYYISFRRHAHVQLWGCFILPFKMAKFKRVQA